MKSVIKRTLQGLLLVPLLALGVSAFVPAGAAYAADCDPSNLTVGSGADCAQGSETPSDIQGENGIFRTIVNVMLFIIGAIAVIMLIIGGIRYTVSGGDSSAVTSAKNTILYAIVGIIVAILAYAIVNFVIGSFID